MKKARGTPAGSGAKIGRGKTVAKSQAPAPAVDAKASVKKARKYTSEIEIRGVGESAEGERFLEVAVASKTALLNVDNISTRDSSELKTLTRLGEPLITTKSRNEFIERAQTEARAKPTFKVPKMTGYCNGTFILPEGLAPEGETGVRRYFDYRYGPYHKRLHRGGSFKGWRKSVELCRGKSRLITGLCLMLSGPVCGRFGDEPPGIGLISKGGMGNTTIGRFISTVWGGDHNPGRKVGCGVSWNNTGINVEVLLGAFNHMAAYFDDMHNAGEPELKALQNGMNGEGRGRSTDAQRAEFCTPLWSSSNTSIVHTALELKRLRQIIPLIDRLMELGVPSGYRYFFEGIKTPQQMREFCGQVRKGARTDFGWAGPEFQRRLDAGIKKNEAAARAFVNKRHDVYHEAAEAIVSTSERDLGRISNKFATIYVTGCLASALKILPFSEAEILAAVRTCHRDHVAFIDDQMRAVGMRFDASAGVAPSTSTGKPIASVVKATERPFDRMRRFVNTNRKDGFVDLDKVSAGGSFTTSTVGYKRRQGRGRNRHTEYFIPDVTFEEVVGESGDRDALKRELFSQGLIKAHGKGSKRRFSIRRSLPDGSRPNFIVLRSKPTK